MSFMDDLAELFDSTVIAQAGVVDGAGDWLASGGNATYPARYEGGPRMVRNAAGQEVVSSLLILINGVLVSHDASIMRFTIPANPFSPHTQNIQALRIDPVSDETGVISAEIYLP